MNINYTFRHMESSDALKQYVEKRLDKLGRYLHEPVKFEVWLTSDKTTYIAESEVRSKGFDNKFSVEGGSDIHEAIDLLASKMEKALRRHKEKVKDHHRNAELEIEA